MREPRRYEVEVPDVALRFFEAWKAQQRTAFASSDANLIARLVLLGMVHARDHLVDPSALDQPTERLARTLFEVHPTAGKTT